MIQVLLNPCRHATQHPCDDLLVHAASVRVLCHRGVSSLGELGTTLQRSQGQHAIPPYNFPEMTWRGTHKTALSPDPWGCTERACPSLHVCCRAQALTEHADADMWCLGTIPS